MILSNINVRNSRRVWSLVCSKHTCIWQRHTRKLVLPQSHINFHVKLRKALLEDFRYPNASICARIGIYRQIKSIFNKAALIYSWMNEEGWVGRGTRTTYTKTPSPTSPHPLDFRMGWMRAANAHKMVRRVQTMSINFKIHNDKFTYSVRGRCVCEAFLYVEPTIGIYYFGGSFIQAK